MNTTLPINNEGALDEHATFADTVRQWAEREVMARRQSLREDYDQLLRPAARGLLLELGLQAHLWPEGAGGHGQTPASAAMTVALALEQAARADVGIGLLAAAGLGTAATIVGSGEAERAASLAPLFLGAGDQERLVAPVLGQLAATDSHGTLPDGRQLQATARREADCCIVDSRGPSRPLCCGADAYLFAVICALDGDVALVLVPGDVSGVRRGGPLVQTGLAASRNAEVSFAGARGRLALEGLDAYHALRGWLGLGLAATCSGALLAGGEILADWAESRVIKGRGQRFVDNPLVAEVMAGFVQRHTLVRLAVRDLARLFSAEASEATHLTSLTVAHFAAQSTVDGLGRAMELMGSAGYSTEWNLERYWRDAKTLQAYLGAAVLDRLEVARHCFDHVTPGEPS